MSLVIKKLCAISPAINKKLKKKCKKLSRELINLKFRCLIRKPGMVVAPRKKRRGLDVLGEASEHMD